MQKSPTKIYLITDTHFDHKRIINDFIFRPPDFVDQIIKNCQNILNPEDKIIHLGDVIWGNKTRLTEILSQIPGTKILVRGNHDNMHSDTFFYESGFSFVCNKIEMGKYVFSHFPEFIKDGQINIHGHFHNIPLSRWEKPLIERLTDNHYLLSLEMNDLSPVLLSTAIAQKKVIKTKDFK